MTNDSVPDLLIIGGGVIGLSLADRALRDGLRVKVLDKSTPGRESSWAGAGMITCRPRPRVREGIPDYHDLTLLAAKLYPEWTARLQAETGIDTGYRVSGALELLPQTLLDEEEQNVASLIAGGRERGMPARRIDQLELRQREPGLNAEIFSGAVEYTTESQIRSPWLVGALLSSIQKRGGSVEPEAAVADVTLSTDGSRATGVVLKSGRELPAGAVAVCSGAWAAELPALVKLAPACGKVHPVKGQLLCYNADPKLARRVMTCDKNYIVPRGDGIYLIGATHELSGFEKTPTEAGREQLTKFAHALLPGLKNFAPIKTWAGLRPGIKGKHPLLGEVRSTQRLFVACGHYRNGLTLAPATAELLNAAIQGRETAVGIEAWRV